MSRSLIHKKKKQNSRCLSVNLFSARRQAAISRLVHQFDSGFIQSLWVPWEGEEGSLGLFWLVHPHSEHRGTQDVLARCHPTTSFWRAAPRSPASSRCSGTCICRLRNNGEKSLLIFGVIQEPAYKCTSSGTLKLVSSNTLSHNMFSGNSSPAILDKITLQFNTAFGELHV